MRFWFDTEFIETGETIELISIGIVSEDDREYYAEVDRINWWRASDWVLANVQPHLMGGNTVRSRVEIADEIAAFVGKNPEFWGYYADYDWVVLCWLYGAMVKLPPTWPMYCLDIRQECHRLGDPRLPEHTDEFGPPHNALADAKWTRHAHKFLEYVEDTEGAPRAIR